MGWEVDQEKVGELSFKILLSYAHRAGCMHTDRILKAESAKGPCSLLMAVIPVPCVAETSGSANWVPFLLATRQETSPSLLAGRCGPVTEFGSRDTGQRAVAASR